MAIHNRSHYNHAFMSLNQNRKEKVIKIFDTIDFSNVFKIFIMC